MWASLMSGKLGTVSIASCTASAEIIKGSENSVKQLRVAQISGCAELENVICPPFESTAAPVYITQRPVPTVLSIVASG